MRKGARFVYLGTAWLFVVGVLAQVFLAGMVVVAARMGWDNHARLGHMLGLPLLIMLITVYVGRFPGSMKRLTWLLFIVYIIQADVLISMRGSAPVVAAFHPVLALVDFALGLKLALAARSAVGQMPATQQVVGAVDRAAAFEGD